MGAPPHAPAGELRAPDPRERAVRGALVGAAGVWRQQSPEHATRSTRAGVSLSKIPRLWQRWRGGKGEACCLAARWLGGPPAKRTTGGNPPSLQGEVF